MESSSVTRYQRFLGAYQQVKQGASDTYRSKIAQLIGQVAPFVQRQKEVRKQTAARFNLFEVLGIARKEQVQSRFLAFLLDPRASHDHEDLFLRTFLEHMLPEFLQQRLDRSSEAMGSLQ